MFIHNIINNFLSKSYIIISYLTQASLFLKTTEATLIGNESLQDIDANNIYTLSLKPYANSSTYPLDRDPDHIFVNIANKEFILCKLARELNFSYDAINSWYLRPVSKMEQQYGVGTIDANDCPEDFIINLYHIREIKDYISNITIPKIGNNITNIMTTYMIGGSEYNLTKKNNDYYILDSNFDSDVCLSQNHTNDCASFKVNNNDTDTSLLNIFNASCTDNIRYFENIVADNLDLFNESISYGFLQQDDIETEQNNISMFNVGNIGTILGIIGVSVCGIYTANKIKTYIQTKYYHDSYNKCNLYIENDQNNIECVGGGAELQEILS